MIIPLIFIFIIKRPMRFCFSFCFCFLFYILFPTGVDEHHQLLQRQQHCSFKSLSRRRRRWCSSDDDDDDVCVCIPLESVCPCCNSDFYCVSQPKTCLPVLSSEWSSLFHCNFVAAAADHWRCSSRSLPLSFFLRPCLGRTLRVFVALRVLKKKGAAGEKSCKNALRELVLKLSSRMSSEE